MGISQVYIIGTSHIAKQSLSDIKKAFDSFSPDIVGVELDRQRYYSLISKTKRKLRVSDIFNIGIKGFIFMLIGAWAEKKLGDVVGMKPGVDMMNAIKRAKKNNKILKFIDRDIQITLKRISKKLTWKEKFNFLIDVFNAVILRKPEMNFDLNQVPDEETISIMIEKLKPRYPNIYAVLIRERDVYMAKKIFELAALNPGKKILAVVGAGHRKGIIEILNNLNHPDKSEQNYSIA